MLVIGRFRLIYKTDGLSVCKLCVYSCRTFTSFMENPAEVQELRNKLRMMKFPQDEILNTVRRQQRAIHKQKAANDTIRDEIAEYEKEISNIDRDIHLYKSNEELQKLQTARKALSNKLSNITADHNAEELKRKKMEEEVSKANSKAGGLFQQSRENEETQGRLRTMENRLDKALVRYSKNLAKLGDLRDRIDELRKDRMNFCEVVKTAQNKQQHRDEQIQELISGSNDAYSERDRRKMELVRLKAAEKADVKAFEDKLLRLNQTIEGHKIAQNHGFEQRDPIPSMASQLGSEQDQQEELTIRYEDQVKAILARIEMANVQNAFDEAERLERENFSLFNFVVEKAAERTNMQEEIDALELQHRTLLSQTETGDQVQGKEIQGLTREIAGLDDELQEMDARRVAEEGSFSSVYTEIESLFNALACDWSESPDGKTTVSPANAMFCLSLIEVVMAEMMAQVYQQASIQCQMNSIRSSSLLPEPPAPVPVAHRGVVQQRVVHEKELAGKVADTTKPLTVEEMMAMLD